MIPIEHFFFLVNISEDIIKKMWFFHNRKLRRKIWSIRIALICKTIIFWYSCRMLSLISGQFYSNSSSVSWIVLISGVTHRHIIYFECYTCSPHTDKFITTFFMWIDLELAKLCFSEGLNHLYQIRKSPGKSHVTA